jgi:hypothetical protein
LPKLSGAKFADIVKATGYSKGHCSTIRACTWTPSVGTWPSLAQLVGVTRRRGRCRSCSW